MVKWSSCHILFYATLLLATSACGQEFTPIATGSAGITTKTALAYTATPTRVTTPTRTTTPQAPPTFTPLPFAVTPRAVSTVRAEAVLPVTPLSTATTTPAVPGELAVAPGYNAQVASNGFGKPQRIVVAPDGTVWFTDQGNNAVNRLMPDRGLLQSFAPNLNRPRGLARTKAGDLLVIESGTRKLLRLPAAGGPALTLYPPAGTALQAEPVGVAVNTIIGDIYLANGSGGQILRLAADGAFKSTLPTTFKRPVDLVIDPWGRLVIADLDGNAVSRIELNGLVQLIMVVAGPTALAVDPQGHLYIAGGDGKLLRINTSEQIQLRPASEAETIMTGLQDVQGIAVAPDGSLLVAEAGRNRIYRVNRR
ncbi:MAG: hypothetical protein EXR62_10190 [Chloroflexi bacterium]|nr:hypothetical protein [Chloroflexota bacterium]